MVRAQGKGWRTGATMKRMSTLVLFLRTSDRKLAFYAAIALKATELIIMLYLFTIYAWWNQPAFQAHRNLV